MIVSGLISINKQVSFACKLSGPIRKFPGVLFYFNFWKLGAFLFDVLIIIADIQYLQVYTEFCWKGILAGYGVCWTSQWLMAMNQSHYTWYWVTGTEVYTNKIYLCSCTFSLYLCCNACKQNPNVRYRTLRSTVSTFFHCGSYPHMTDPWCRGLRVKRLVS